MPYSLIVAMMLASAPVEAAGVRDFSGIYINGFEISDFISCDAATMGARWWRGGYSDQEMKVVDAWRKREKRGAAGFPYLWLEFSGVLSPPGRYGHLGLYPHSVSTMDLKVVRVVTEADLARCKVR